MDPRFNLLATLIPNHALSAIRVARDTRPPLRWLANFISSYVFIT
jgi:hypothetical protein